MRQGTNWLSRHAFAIRSACSLVCSAPDATASSARSKVTATAACSQSHHVSISALPPLKDIFRLTSGSGRRGHIGHGRRSKSRQRACTGKRVCPFRPRESKAWHRVLLALGLVSSVASCALAVMTLRQRAALATAATTTSNNQVVVGQPIRLASAARTRADAFYGYL